MKSTVHVGVVLEHPKCDALVQALILHVRNTINEAIQRTMECLVLHALALGQAMRQVCVCMHRGDHCIALRRPQAVRQCTWADLLKDVHVLDVPRAGEAALPGARPHMFELLFSANARPHCRRSKQRLLALQMTEMITTHYTCTVDTLSLSALLLLLYVWKRAFNSLSITLPSRPWVRIACRYCLPLASC